MKFPHPISALLLSFGLTLSSTVAIASEDTKYAESGFILTTIKPLQLIAADIHQGVIKSIALLPPGASPHAYALRPSQMKKVHGATAIYWVDPMLESFVKKSFNQYADKNFALAALTEQMQSQPTEDSHAHESAAEHAAHAQEEHHDEHSHDDHADEHDEHSAHSEETHQEDSHQHHHGGKDLHIWLNPNKALQMAKIMQLNSTQLFPQHRDQLAANYQRFEQKIHQLDVDLKEQLSSLKEAGFLVFHDGYSGFVDHYQLKQVAALTINPSQRPGAKHLAELNDLITKDKPRCIFSEPQFSPASVKSLVGNYSINIGQLDPLATAVKVDSDRYTTFLQSFAQQFVDCLGK